MTDTRKIKLQIAWDALHGIGAFTKEQERHTIIEHIKQEYEDLFTEKELNNKFLLMHNGHYLQIYHDYLLRNKAIKTLNNGTYILNEEFYEENVFLNY